MAEEKDLEEKKDAEETKKEKTAEEENEVEAEEAPEDTQKGKYMTFYCGNECYGIGLKYVNEIIGIQPITEIPEVEDYIIGLINLRGKIIPVVDVRIRFNKAPMEYNDRTCIIIVDVKEVVIGLIVDTIAEVVSIADEDIIPPPTLSKGMNQPNRFVYGIGRTPEGVKLLVDPEKLIRDSEAVQPEKAEE